MHQTILLTCEDDTTRLAQALLEHLKPGDVILLEGPVGAGKTALARAIIQGQMAKDGKVEDVPSPTFTLIQTYETSRGSFCHADLYRLSDSSELEELGFPELFDDTITLIEWPTRLGSLKPDRQLTISISFPDASDAREVSLLPSGKRWDWIKRINTDPLGRQ